MGYAGYRSRPKRIVKPESEVPKSRPKGLGLTLKSHGQRDQGLGVVLHDPGEGYQEPTTFMSGSSQVV